MAQMRTLGWCLASACIGLLLGCGSSGPGPSGTGTEGPVPPVGSTVTMGALQVDVESAAGFRSLVLGTPSDRPIAFMALYGTKISRLQELARGAKIAFRADRDGDSEIYVMNADGSDQTNLTNDHEAAEYGPAWSPDGTKIAYARSATGNAEIYVMNADGTGQANLTNHAASDGAPAWSPDGRQIAFVTNRDGDYEIFVMEADGSAQTQITSNSDKDYGPAWSPDGRQIAFVSDRDGDREIYTMKATGAGQRNLTDDNTGDDQSPSWSPDGKQIAFQTDRDGPRQVYVMDADGSDQTNLSNVTVVDYQPSWSPDGRKIAFTSFRDSVETIYVMNTDGSEATNLTEFTGWPDQEPSWCPAPSVKRTLIGTNNSDGGGDPPFGDSRPLAIVGLRGTGLVSAATVVMNTTAWSSLSVEALKELGSELSGVSLTGSGVKAILEDQGRGIPALVWNLRDSPYATTALVFFSTETAAITTVLGVADKTLTIRDGDRIVVRGNVLDAYDASDRAASLLTGPANEVVLDASTGVVLSAD